MNRSMILGASLLGLAAGLSFAPGAKASPLIPAAPLAQAADDGVTQVHWRYRHHHRHYGWRRGHHYGWYKHRHYRRGYY